MPDDGGEVPDDFDESMSRPSHRVRDENALDSHLAPV
jgi:hypothetical protein